jgi:hypothetical protein
MEMRGEKDFLVPSKSTIQRIKKLRAKTMLNLPERRRRQVTKPLAKILNLPLLSLIRRGKVERLSLNRMLKRMGSSKP